MDKFGIDTAVFIHKIKNFSERISAGEVANSLHQVSPINVCVYKPDMVNEFCGDLSYNSPISIKNTSQPHVLEQIKGGKIWRPRYNYPVELNSDLTNIFNKIIARYRDTEQDKNFNIILHKISETQLPNLTVRIGHVAVSFLGNVYNTLCTTDRLHKLANSEWSKYLVYSMSFTLTFTNDYESMHKSNYIPNIIIETITVDINPSIVKMKSVKILRKKVRTHFSEQKWEYLPDELMDHIASFLDPENIVETNVTYIIKENVVEYIGTNIHIQDILSAYGESLTNGGSFRPTPDEC
jgi:hypothetical protein